MPGFGTLDDAMRVLGDQNVTVSLGDGNSIFVDPNIPAASDYCGVIAMGERILGGALGAEFVIQFRSLTMAQPRDFSQLLLRIAVAARARGYEVNTHTNAYRVLHAVYKQIVSQHRAENTSAEKTVTLFTDVVVSAVLDCPPTEDSIYV